MRPRRSSPAERVRSRLAALTNPAGAVPLPRGYQRLGSVLVLRLPESLRPLFPAIGAAWRQELGVRTVLRHAGRTEGEFRAPATEVIAGGQTETEVVENGVRYRFDAARIMFAAGNQTERARLGRLVRKGEDVVDLFAGIGYFTLPLAMAGRASRVTALEANPLAYGYLVENLRLNRPPTPVEPVLGDNRTVPLPPGSADRVVLGYLPSSLPWVGRAVELLRKEGGTVHVHLVVGAREGLDGAEALVRREFELCDANPVVLRAREVKPYGPGRMHAVVDASVGRRR